MRNSSCDATYGFFYSPTLDYLPRQSRRATKRISKPVTCPSDIDLVTYRPRSNIKTHPIEDWIMDTSYGLFEAPTMALEPVHYEEQPSKMSATTPTPAAATRDSSMDCTDGYSYFGI
jgi:hypothetical protein